MSTFTHKKYNRVKCRGWYHQTVYNPVNDNPSTAYSIQEYSVHKYRVGWTLFKCNIFEEPRFNSDFEQYEPIK